MSDTDLNDIDFNENITVKFLVNDYHTVVQVYSGDSSIHSILGDIAEKFQINSKYIQIFHEFRPLLPERKLFEICHNEYQIIEFELKLNELANQYNETVTNEMEKVKLDCDIYYR